MKLIQITISEGNLNQYSYLKEYIQTLNEFLELIPEEFRDEACISFSTYENYDMTEINQEIYYYRKETESEIALKEEREKLRLEEIKHIEILNAVETLKKYNVTDIK